MKTHLTSFQLFFLTFLYVYSGLALADADSLLALFVPMTACVLWATVGYRGAANKRGDLTDFLSVYLPRKETVIPIAFFLFVSAAEAVLVLFDVSVFLGAESEFISFPLLLMVLLGIAVLACCKGVTVLGRFSETVLFLLVPIFMIHLFGKFTPIAMTGDASGVRLVFSVMPAPIFFLLSMTTVSGDAGTSAALRVTENAPKSRARYLVATVILGALFAGLLRVGLLMLPFGEHELMLYFLEYMAHVVRLSLLLSVCAHGIPKKDARGALYTVLMITAVVFTVATVGGAVFSPFLWMTLLVCLNVTVAMMLGIFSFR